MLVEYCPLRPPLVRRCPTGRTVAEPRRSTSSGVLSGIFNWMAVGPERAGGEAGPCWNACIGALVTGALRLRDGAAASYGPELNVSFNLSRWTESPKWLLTDATL